MAAEAASNSIFRKKIEKTDCNRRHTGSARPIHSQAPLVIAFIRDSCTTSWHSELCPARREIGHISSEVKFPENSRTWFKSDTMSCARPIYLIRDILISSPLCQLNCYAPAELLPRQLHTPSGAVQLPTYPEWDI